MESGDENLRGVPGRVTVGLGSQRPNAEVVGLIPAAGRGAIDKNVRS